MHVTSQYGCKRDSRVEVRPRDVGGRKDEDHERDTVAKGRLSVGRVPAKQLEEHQTKQLGEQCCNKLAVPCDRSCVRTARCTVLACRDGHRWRGRRRR